MSGAQSQAWLVVTLNAEGREQPAAERQARGQPDDQIDEAVELHSQTSGCSGDGGGVIRTPVAVGPPA